jgi:fatty acid desaturase
MAAPSKDLLRALHRPRWSDTWIWLGFLAAFFALQALLLAVLLAPLPGPAKWAAAAVLVLALGHLMHGHLLAFHEAAHRSLCPYRPLNEALGVFIGSLGFMSLSLYRAVHHLHHVYLTTERDEELWPFVTPAAPRWARRLAVLGELAFALVYTPLLFLRAFLRPGTVIRERSTRRRIWAELALLGVVLAAVVAATVWWGLWEFTLVMYFLPACLAASMQSLRKYVEHMGLTGTTPLGATRSVLPAGWAGRLFAFTLFNEPYHGAHHTYPRVPLGELPRLASALAPAPGEPPPFSSYRRALADMLRTLGDPRVGAQWLGARQGGQSLAGRRRSE